MYFSKIISIFIICSITLVESFNCPFTPNSHEAPQTFIIQLSPTASRDAIKNHYAMLTSCFAKTISDDSTIQLNHPSIIKDISFGSFNCYVGKFSPSDAAKLAKLSEVINVENDKKYKIDSKRISTRVHPKTPPTIPTNLDRIDQQHRPLDGKYTFPRSAGSNVNVYILDTGINVKHEEFGGRAIFGPVLCEGCPHKDDHGHGSNVAGIVGGTKFGVAKNVTLISVKVCSASGGCDGSAILSGISFVGKQHTKSNNKNTVINMSLGGFGNDLNNAVVAVGKLGVHVVVAAGNDATNDCLVTPASAPNAIAVGATETTSDAIAIFSNFGNCTNIFAPGTLITAAGNQDSKGLITFNGTSQATPHVAGTVALIIASSGNKSPGEMRNFLDDLSTKDVVKNLDEVTPNRFVRVPQS